MILYSRIARDRDRSLMHSEYSVFFFFWLKFCYPEMNLEIPFSYFFLHSWMLLYLVMYSYYLWVAFRYKCIEANSGMPCVCLVFLTWFPVEGGPGGFLCIQTCAEAGWMVELRYRQQRRTENLEVLHQWKESLHTASGDHFNFSFSFYWFA